MSVCIYANAQCRLEANYAHQQELDMIPLMMEENYKPQGWRESERPHLALIVPIVMMLTWRRFVRWQWV